MLLLAAAFLLHPLLPSGVAEVQAAPGSSLKEQLEDNRSRLEKIRGNIDKAEAARKAALGDIAALDKNIDGLEDEVRLAEAAYDQAARELAGLREQLDAVTIELNQKRNQLARTERDLRRQQEVLNERVVNMYKSGGRLMYLASLLETASINEVLGRVDFLTTIAQQDNNMLAQIDDLKTKVEDQKAALESERARVSELEQQQRATTEVLEAQTEKKQAALAQLEEARAAKAKVLAAAEKDKAKWSKQEDELSAESDRIAAQIRAAEEAARKGEPNQPQPKPSQPPSSGQGGGDGKLYRPVPGPITSPFGYRMHPIFKVRKMHTGVDMRAAMGTPIHAAQAGTVISAGWRGGYGKCVVISHSGNLSTLYAHLSSIGVSVGQKVGRGHVIGAVGSTGYSTGPHLHFEVRVGGSPVNPAGYL